eukprot:TRINITY_DN19525_c0_g1_i1.p2 TRINITY_DN19525_c0_g1~~TRINITY_DN19525_c0_g1_i1.p2  ORF type:complete len:272 (+),score=58.33 TRINITY_DN19525_c0_g1_i1:605-1420(+)
MLIAAAQGGGGGLSMAPHSQWRRLHPSSAASCLQPSRRGARWWAQVLRAVLPQSGCVVPADTSGGELALMCDWVVAGAAQFRPLAVGPCGRMRHGNDRVRKRYRVSSHLVSLLGKAGSVEKKQPILCTGVRWSPQQPKGPRGQPAAAAPAGGAPPPAFRLLGPPPAAPHSGLAAQLRPYLAGAVADRVLTAPGADLAALAPAFPFVAPSEVAEAVGTLLQQGHVSAVAATPGGPPAPPPRLLSAPHDDAPAAAGFEVPVGALSRLSRFAPY